MRYIIIAICNKLHSYGRAHKYETRQFFCIFFEVCFGRFSWHIKFRFETMIVSFSWPARKKHNSVCLPFAIVPYSESYGHLSSSGRACISRVVGPPIADHAEVFCELSTWSKKPKIWGSFNLQIACTTAG